MLIHFFGFADFSAGTKITFSRRVFQTILVNARDRSGLLI